MKSLLRAYVALLSLTIVTGCTSTSAGTKADAPKPVFNKVCVISGDPLDGTGPTVFLNDKVIGFCCDKCVAKFAAMDPFAKQAAVDKASK